MERGLASDLRTLRKQAHEVADLLASLGHSTRLLVMCELLSGPKSVSEMINACRISQPILSQFLARMRRDGLVESERDGQRMIYRLKDRRLQALLQSIKHLYCEE